jgi:hypothetical protein
MLVTLLVFLARCRRERSVALIALPVAGRPRLRLFVTSPSGALMHGRSHHVVEPHISQRCLSLIDLPNNPSARTQDHTVRLTMGTQIDYVGPTQAMLLRLDRPNIVNTTIYDPHHRVVVGDFAQL